MIIIRPPWSQTHGRQRSKLELITVALLISVQEQPHNDYYQTALESDTRTTAFKIRTHHRSPPPHPHPRRSRCRPPRSLSPAPQDPHEPQRTRLLPYPLRHTSARMHAWST